MDEITLLRHNWIKAYLVVPILSILTLFFLPLKMYWDNALNARMIYSPVLRLEQATHVLVKGRDGKVAVCELKNLTQ